MLHFEHLSFWEKQTLFEDIDFVVVGGGIVGAACAVKLRSLYPSAKIVLIERGYVSTGASTKNAGFACFGSVTELADDLQTMNETTVWDTVAMRYEGLQRLRERFPDELLEAKYTGSWDLIAKEEQPTLPVLNNQIDYFNEQIQRITGHSTCFSYDQTIQKKCGFQHIVGGYYNRLEGEINTGKLLLATNRLLAQNNIHTLYGIEVKSINYSNNSPIIETNFGEIITKKIAITVNGFAGKLLNDARIQPARAQVLVTEEIPGFKLPGTFHYQKGYYYFRAVGNRLLLGGGRNLNFEGENTTSFEQTKQISDALNLLIQERLLPERPVKIAYRWSGIMGIGNEKKPLIEKIHPNIAIGVRMGGMGVAIGSLVGEELALLL